MKLTRRSVLAASAAVAGVGSGGVVRAEESDDGVGGVEDIVNHAWSTLVPDPKEEIEFEDAIYMNGVVKTGEESALVTKFSDGSKHALGENAKVVIDKHVYNHGGESSRAVTLTKGAFRFLPGSMPKSQGQIKTPSVAIGIRGTELFCDVSEDGETEMSTLEDQSDATDGSGETLTVNPEESIVTGPDRQFRGRVRRFRHVTRSIAIAEGLGGASKRWRTRKAKQRRAVRRTDRRRRING